jgi:hypothetical protein
MHCCANRCEGARRVLWRTLVGFAWAWLACTAWAQNKAESNKVEPSKTDFSVLRVELETDGLYLSATMNFSLAPVVQEALLKGVPITFVTEAQLFKDRWYWTDKQIAAVARSARLAYQPSTKRWRLSVGSGTGEFSSGASLSQNFDQLDDALTVLRRVWRWKIAEIVDLEAQARHSVDFSFRLDTTQLPRPMQIGITGNPDWVIALQRNVRPEGKVAGKVESGN